MPNFKDESKRQLLESLALELDEWANDARLGRRRSRRIQRILDSLRRCRLFVGERYRLDICDIWLARARTGVPDKWLKAMWLADVRLWLRYVDAADRSDSFPVRESRAVYASAREDPYPYLPLFPRPLV